MFLKKLISTIIAVAAICLMLSNGFQQLASTKTHVMDGKIMATQQMPSQGCSQKNCIIKTEAQLLIATFLKPFVKEFLTFISLLAGLTLLAFLSLNNRRLFSKNFLNLNWGALSVSTIVFRE